MRLGPDRHSRDERRHAQASFPDAVELVVMAIRAGQTPVAAVRWAGEVVDPSLVCAWAAFEHRLTRGAAFADALGALHDHVGPTAAEFVTALATTDRYGLAIAPVLDRLLDDARDMRRRAAERDARRLPVTMAIPLVVCTLPSFVLLAVVPAVLGAIAALRGPLS